MKLAHGRAGVLVIASFVALLVLSWLRPVQRQQRQQSQAAPAGYRPPRPAAGFKVVEAGYADPLLDNESDRSFLRRRPSARYALRRALRAAIAAAKRNESADPLELLAERLLQRAGRWERRHGGVAASETATLSTSPAMAPAQAGGEMAFANRTRRTGPVPSAPKAASRHSLPTKLPTRGMWPPIQPPAPGEDPPASRYRSLGKVAHYRGGDLEEPGELRRAASARSYRGELILTYGNEAGTAWIANLVFSLRAAGIEHYLVIVMSDEHCRALSRPPWMISCAWSSWDFGGCKRPGELRRLWYSRHHYMSRVINELQLNVAVVDGDMFVQRDFYPMLKSAPLAAHNLIYSLDHGPTCGDLNVGFAYCQRCSAGGHAQWAIDEGLRRENHFCGGQEEEFGNHGRFWKKSDESGASSGPHNWVEWTTARDQKIYSDVVGGACCNKPQYRLLFPGTHKVKDQYEFMRQWGQHAQCRTMEPQKANGLQTWWHQLLSGSEKGAPKETVAVATGQLLSGWHGTGQGELAGWSGHWNHAPPAIAHFVGGAPAGGKVDIMQGLNWWHYESDVVAHAVAQETGKNAGMALPASFFSARTQHGLLALAGPAAVLRIDDRETFVKTFVALRWWLLTVAAVLGRTAVDPQPHCECGWVPSDRKTGHGSTGYRERWYTPGWPWPFKGGVGVVLGNCSYGEGRRVPSDTPADCCSAIFGQISGVKCLETAHRMVLEQTLAAPGSHERLAAELPLSALVVDGGIDAAKLRALAPQYTQQVLWITPPSSLPTDLPPVYGFSEAEKALIGELVHDEKQPSSSCKKEYLPKLEATRPPGNGSKKERS